MFGRLASRRTSFHSVDYSLTQLPQNTRRERWTSGPLTAKSISIKDAKRRPGDGARKATELTPGDLLGVVSTTGSAVRRSDRRAEVSRGRIRPCCRQG